MVWMQQQSGVVLLQKQLASVQWLTSQLHLHNIITLQHVT